jgi:hypothetical protein
MKRRIEFGSGLAKVEKNSADHEIPCSVEHISNHRRYLGLEAPPKNQWAVREGIRRILLEVSPRESEQPSLSVVEDI